MRGERSIEEELVKQKKSERGDRKNSQSIHIQKWKACSEEHNKSVAE